VAAVGSRHGLRLQQCRAAGEFFSQTSEDRAIYNRYFCNQRDGRCVELGGLNGITYSNPLFFERSMGWTGTLIEAQPDNVAAKLEKKRGSISRTFAMAVCPEGVGEMTFVGHCACAPRPGFAGQSYCNRRDGVGPETFLPCCSCQEIEGGEYGGFCVAGLTTGAVGMMAVKGAYHRSTGASYKVPCKPMSAILRESGIKKIDLFSLGVEGSEFAVLQTMDWNVPVHVWRVIELDGMDKAKDENVRKLLASKGYVKETKWDIRSACNFGKGHDCTSNEAWVHPSIAKSTHQESAARALTGSQSTAAPAIWDVPTGIFDMVDDVLQWVSTFDANADALLCNAEVRSMPTTAAVFLPRFERMRVVGAPAMCLRYGMIEAALFLGQTRLLFLLSKPGLM
jgi:hypothetical protein